VARLGRADKVIVGDRQLLPQAVVSGDHPVGELEGLDALSAGGLRNLLSVLVGAGEQSNLSPRIRRYRAYRSAITVV